MKAEKEDNIDFQGPEKSKALHISCKVKYTIVAVVSVTLLVAAVSLLVAFWPGKHKVSKCLVEVNLEEGDTLMYRVDQSFEVKEKDSQKETISSTVGFQVVNKTSYTYWFLLKINTTFKDDDEEVKSAITGYFRVQLPSTKDYSEDTGNDDTTELFELHGYPQTDGKFVRYLHGILYQLLPAVRRDLYEDVDGQTDQNVKPENSPLFPGPVRMHRQANTKEIDDVLVKNHFNQSDLVNSSSDMDIDVKYNDSATINKTNGMVSESNIYVSEELHFGEPIKTKDGHDVTTMMVNLYSHVTRIEMDSAYFVEEEIKALKIDSFVMLVVPTEESSLDDTLDGQRLSTQEPTTVIRRNRRAVGPDSNRTATPYPGGNVGGGGGGGNGTVGSSRGGGGGSNGTVGSIGGEGNGTVGSLGPKLFLRSLLNLSLAMENTFSLFDKKLLGIRTKGEGSTWLKTTAFDWKKGTNEWEMGTDLYVTLGSIKKNIYRVKYSNEEIENENGREVGKSWSKGIPPICFSSVLIVSLCAEFTLHVDFNIKPPKLLSQETSLSPPKIALQVEAFAEVKASVEAYASALVVRAGVFVDGTIVRVTVPTKLSYSAVKPANQKWCLASNANLTALELHAGLFYQWRECRFIFMCRWGTRNTISSFGTWAALSKDFKLYGICF